MLQLADHPVAADTLAEVLRHARAGLLQLHALDAAAKSAVCDVEAEDAAVLAHGHESAAAHEALELLNLRAVRSIAACRLNQRFRREQALDKEVLVLRVWVLWEALRKIST